MKEVQNKPNDWLVATVSNPDLGLANFAEAGLNAENTQLKDRSFYKNSQFVQDTFKTEDGKFDEVKFNKAYDNALNQYEAFSTDSFDKSYLDQLSASFTNSFRSPSASIRNESVKTAKVENPFRELKGLQGFGSIQESHLSVSEIAQQNKVFDYDSNKFLDWSPNDKSGLKSFFKDPLVLAQWDEDGTHSDNNGRTIKHKKGDFKYNEDGDVYYETLGNRDASKKQFLSSFDTLTIDGSMANEFDIFDTDDKEQNITKAIARMGLKWAPLLLAGIASGGTSTVAAAAIGFNKVYLGTTALLNLTEAMPMLYKSIEGILTNNDDMNQRSGLWNVMNTIQGKTASSRLGVSEYSKNKTFTWENTINMMSDVMLQLGQQRFIAEIPKHLGLEKRFIESAARAGKNPYEGVKKFNDFSSALATYYMTVTSGADAYNTAINAGNSERTAGLLTLGTLVGLNQITKSDIGQWGLKGIGLDDLRVTLKPILKEEAAKAAEGHMITEGLEATVKGSQNKVLNFIQGIGNKVSNRIKGFIENPETFIGAMVNEAIEEVSEEMTQDAVFGLGKAAEALGITRKSNWDWFETDIISRYAMSAFGGAVGGGMHHVNWNAFRGVVSSLDEKTKKDIIYATYKYGSAEVNKMIDKMYKNSELAGSKTLGVNPEQDADGNKHFIETSSEESSQAYIIKEQLKNTVNTIEQLLSQTGSNGLELDARRALNIEGDEGLERLAGLGLTGIISSDLLSINTEILDLTLKVKDLEGADGSGNGGEYRARLDELITEKNWILSGERFDDYFQYGLLYLNPELASQFTIANKEDMSEKLLGKSYNALSEFEQEVIDNKYKNYKEKQGQDLKYAVKIINLTNEKLDPHIAAYGQDYKNTRLMTQSQLKANVEAQLEALKIINQETGELDAQKLAETKGMPIVGTPLIVDPATPISEIINAISAFKQSGLPLDEEVAKVFRKAINEIKTITKVNFNKNISEQVDEIIPITGDTYISLDKMPVIKQLFDQSFDLSEFDSSKLIKEIEELTTEDLFSQIKESTVRSINVIEYEDDEEVGSHDYFTAETTDDLAKEFKKYLKERVKAIKQVIEQSYATELNGAKMIADELKSTVKNPVFSYLNDVSKLTGSNTSGLFQTLANEELRLNQKELTEYIVADGNNLQILQKAIQDIKIAKILTNQRIEQEGYQSYGSILNKYRQKNASKNPLLSMIDMETAMLINGDLDQLQQQIQFFIDLSLYNSADKLREHKKIGAKFMSNFARLFVEGDPNAILQQVKDKLGFNLLEGVDEVIANDFEGYNNLTDALPKLVASGATIPDDVANKAEVTLTKIEDKLFENFQKHLASNPGVNLTDLFKVLYKDIFVLEKNNPESIVEEVTTDLSSLPDKKLTDFDKMVYISTILSSKSSDFKTILKNHIENLPADSQIAPIFGQEYPARIAFGMMSNPEIFNGALNSIQDKNGNLFYPMIQNILFINGYPGTGKTSATAGLIHSITKALGKSFTITSILDRQVDTLKDSLGEDQRGMNKEQLLGSILKGKSIQDVTNSESSYKDKNFIKEEELDKLLNNEEVGQVIYIDEVTHYTTQELLVISRWANKTNRVLITFGDVLQNGKKEDIQGLSVVKSPTLEYSMRAGAVIVRDNSDVFRIITKKLNDYESIRKDDNGNPLKNDDAILNAQENTLSDLMKNSVLKYYETANGLITGIKVLNENNSQKTDLAKYIESIVAYGTKNIGIIYDNERQDDYQDLKDLSEQYGVSLMSKDKMQGAEFDYVILSCDLSKSGKNPLVYAKLLNTLFSRAKLGIITKEKGLGVQNSKSEYNDRQFIPEDVLTKFKENRLIPLTEIASTNTEFKIATDAKAEDDTPAHTEPPKNPKSLLGTATDQVMAEVLGLSNYEEEYQNIESEYEYGPNGEKTNPSKIADNIGLMQAGYKTFGGYFEDGKYVLPALRSGKIGENLLFDLQAFATEVNDKGNITEVSGIDSEINASLLQDYDLFTNTLFNGMLEGKTAKQIIENMDNNLFVNDLNGLIDAYDWTNAKLKLLYTKADKTLDENYEVGGGADTSYLNGGKIIKRIVIWADGVSKGDRSAVLTIGSVMSKEADDQVKKTDNAAKSEVEKYGYATRIITPEAFEQSGSYTRIERRGAIDFSLSSFLNDEPRWKKLSKPMIFTGKAPLNLDPELLDTESENYRENLERFLYSSSLNGQAFTFITYDPEFKDKTDKDLAEYFFNQRIERIQRREALKRGEKPSDRKYPGKITMVLLNPRSMSIPEFFNRFRTGIEEIKQGKTKALNSISNRYLGLNILKSVYELNQYLHAKDNLTEREKAIKSNTWNILKMIEVEFHLRCETVQNSQNENVTEVLLLDGNVKNPKPLDLSEDLLEKALSVKSDTEYQYRSKLYNKYYKKIENLIDGKGFTDLLLYFSDITNPQNAAIEKSVKAEYFAQTIEMAMTGKIGKDEIDKERKGQFKPRFPNGIHSHPIYLGDKNSNNITDWMEASANSLQEFEVSGVRVEARRYKIDHSSNFLFTEENFNNNQKKKAQELINTKNKIVNEFKNVGASLEVIDTVEKIVKSKDTINNKELATEINNKLKGLPISSLNVTDTKDPLITLTIEDNLSVTAEHLSDFKVIENVDISSVKIKENNIEILTAEGDSKLFKNRQLYDLEPASQETLNKRNDEANKLNEDVNKYISGLTNNLVLQNVVTKMFMTNDLSFKEIKAVSSQLKEDQTFMKLLDRKLALEC